MTAEGAGHAPRPGRGGALRWLLAGLTLLVGASAVVWGLGAWRARGFTEYAMPDDTDIPTAIAIAPDGTVWFTIEFSDAIGRLRAGRIEKLRKGSQNVEPLGLGVDAQGFAWYTDGPIRSISRMSPDGHVTSYRLSTPFARLARLAVAPDGAVWFAEATAFSVTRLKDGVFTRHEATAPGASPFGVAVASDGTVWATIQNTNQLVRITPDGAMAELDIPTRASQPGDIAVDARGGVWYLQLRTGRIGRYTDGRFSEFPLPTASAGLTSLAVAPDGAVWFTELRAHRLGRLRDGIVTEFPLPRRDARPFGVTVDAGNNVWYADLSGWVGRLAAERAMAR